MKFNLCLLFLSIFSAVALTYPSEMLEERACHPGRCTGYYSCCKNSPNHFCIPVPCNSATFGSITTCRSSCPLNYPFHESGSCNCY
ncbi:unnamed protein product [Rhizophagus irregularis]|nr:unnamed protein product [Rhizophagus irregularis]